MRVGGFGAWSRAFRVLQVERLRARMYGSQTLASLFSRLEGKKEEEWIRTWGGSHSRDTEVPVSPARERHSLGATDSKRRGNDLNRFKDSTHKAKARIWPGMSYGTIVTRQRTSSMQERNAREANWSGPGRYRANMAYTGQSMPDSGLGFQAKVRQISIFSRCLLARQRRPECGK